MLQIGYFSTAVGPQDAGVVHDILVRARRANRRDSVTGLLVAGGGRYLQIIEGPTGVVETLYDRIAQDRRHLAVTQFLKRTIVGRNFGDWAMAYRPHTGDRSDDLHSMLDRLTHEVGDTGLKQKIRFFARAVMSECSPPSPVGASQ